MFSTHSWVSDIRDIRIYFGHNPIVVNETPYSSVKEIHNHPRADLNRTHPLWTDLSLFKLSNPPNDRPEIKSICLPEKGIINEKRELAMNAGRGHDSWPVTVPAPLLQMGYKMLMSLYTMITKGANPTSDQMIILKAALKEAIKERVYTSRADNRSLSCGVSNLFIRDYQGTLLQGW